MAHGVEVTRDRLATFPADSLTVLAEHSSIFYDLMVDDVVQLLFAKGTFAQLQPYFRYLHFTTEHMTDVVPSGKQPKPVRSVLFTLCDACVLWWLCVACIASALPCPCVIYMLQFRACTTGQCRNCAQIATHRRPIQLLRFSFNLPWANDNMADMARLLQAVMLFIDVVGQYKMSPEQLKRGAKVRRNACCK